MEASPPASYCFYLVKCLEITCWVSRKYSLPSYYTAPIAQSNILSPFCALVLNTSLDAITSIGICLWKMLNAVEDSLLLE